MFAEEFDPEFEQAAALDADELMSFADRIEQLPSTDAVWVERLLQECMRARMREAEILANQDQQEPHASRQDFEDQLAQATLDAAEWLKTLWNVGYMGAGSFPSAPRSEFPDIDLEDVLKSALFARSRAGKRPLPFPPPTRNGLPWHDLLDSSDIEYEVSAEIIYDEENRAIAAQIEGDSAWKIMREDLPGREYTVQHAGKGALFKLVVDPFGSRLCRETPHWTQQIIAQERAGFHSYRLIWSIDEHPKQTVPLRAATWERAESEANYWIATKYPEMYGQVRFERLEL